VNKGPELGLLANNNPSAIAACETCCKSNLTNCLICPLPIECLGKIDPQPVEEELLFMSDLLLALKLSP
jgi:hypothetical protein